MEQGDTTGARTVLDVLSPYAVSEADLDQVGFFYSELKQFEQALQVARHMYDHTTNAEQKYHARVNMIRALISLNRPRQALELVQLNEQEQAPSAANLMDKAMCLFMLNQKSHSEQILRNILQECPDDDIRLRVEFNLGTHDLYQGRFRQGLQRILVEGKKLDPKRRCRYDRDQYWNGAAEPGATLVIVAEGGIGDEIIDVRFMQHVTDLGMKPIWLTTRSDLAAVFQRHGWETMSHLPYLPKDWLWTWSMSLPCSLDLDRDQVWSGPYLQALRQQPPLPGRKKIGIKCSGNSEYEHNLNRTVPWQDLVEVIPADYTIYSFERENVLEHPRVINLGPHLETWDVTLDFLSQMHVVVSSCTSLIHAAGALGRPCHVLVPIAGYYTWCQPGDTTAWYGTVNLVQQHTHGSWQEPLAQIGSLL